MVSAPNGLAARLVQRTPGMAAARDMLGRWEVGYWIHFLFGSLRLAIALLALVLCLLAWHSIGARAELGALPDYDYLAAADSLRAEERYGEALLVINEGFDATPTARRTSRVALEDLKERVTRERDALLANTRQAAPAETRVLRLGSPSPTVSPAVLADLLVFDDVKALTRKVALLTRGAGVEPLPGAGPLPAETAWAVTFVHLCRRAGVLGPGLLHALDQALRPVSTPAGVAQGALQRAVSDDIVDLTRAAQPGPALRILAHISDLPTLHLAATAAQRPGGSFTLWLGGEQSLAWLARGDSNAAPLLEHAARKGLAGMGLLARRGPDFQREHPVLLLLRSVHGGPMPRPLIHLFQDDAIAVLGVVMGWVIFEVVSLAAHSHLHARARALRRQLGWLE